MVKTNRGNIGIILFALSSTAVSNPCLIEEDTMDILKNHSFKEASYYPTNLSRGAYTLGLAGLSPSVSAETVSMEASIENDVFSFAHNLINNSQDISPDFAEIVENEFWNMI